MVSSGSNSYTYDGFNRRVKQTDTAGTSYSFYTQKGRLIYRLTAQGDENYIYLGNRLIAKDGIVNDNNAKQHFKPYGGSIEGAPNDVNYTGHKFDKDLGLIYAQARYYDPVIGRFYSNDPIGFRDVHSFNRYVYGNNSPLNNTDPTGMQADCATGNCTPPPCDCRPNIGQVIINGIKILGSAISNTLHNEASWTSHYKGYVKTML